MQDDEMAREIGITPEQVLFYESRGVACVLKRVDRRQHGLWMKWWPVIVGSQHVMPRVRIGGARPRERHSARSSKSGRGSPDSDEPAPALALALIRERRGLA